jgi:porin
MRSLRLTFCSLIVVAAFSALAVGEPEGAATQSIDSSATTLSLTPTPAPESVDEQLIEAAARPAGILKYGPVSLIDPILDKVNASLDEIGLKFGIAYTAVFQFASGGPGTRQVGGGDIDFFGDWRLLGRPGGEYNGSLYFATENRHTLGSDIGPSSLGGEVGSLWGTTNGFGEQPFAVKELYWQQHFGGDRLLFRIGKIDAENYYNSNYWQSDSKFFMNQAFSSFPVRAFPSNGLGINATVKLSDAWYVSAGAQDAQGKKTEAGFDTLFEDWNLFSAVELGFTPTIEGLGKGTYRFTPWYRDAGESNGKAHDAGFVVSIDQHVGPHFVPFFRAGIGEGNLNGIAQMVSTGVGWEGKILTESDVVGLAAAWGNPEDEDLRDQWATEIFYRLQASPDNQLTIGYQVIFEPAKDPDHDIVGVLELRWRITF